jgi:hypothetical protein
MKIIISGVLFLLSLMSALGREKGASASLHIFQQITISLATDYIEKKVALPKSFEDISSIQQLALGHPIYIKHLNTLTIVPEAPLIQRKTGSLNGSYAHRLFAIARKPDDLPKIGRQVILIRQEDLGCITAWIPESEAQFILNQLKGFDPEKQPLAFQDLVQGGIKTLPAQRDLNRHQNPSIHSQPPYLPESPSVVRTFKGRDEYFLLWIVVGITVLVVGSGYAIRRARK